MNRNVIPARKNRKGFTLVELLVVVLILAILMAVAIPAYLAAVHESRRRTCRANMQTLAHAEQAYLLRSPDHKYADDLNTLVGPGNTADLQALPICPNGGTYGVTTNGGLGPLTITCTIVDDNTTSTGNKGYQPGRDAE